jgi:CheY-like chemotaxis protein
MARILIAEDDVSLGRIFVRWLENAGHEVTLVANGLEGLRATSFGGGAPDLLVTDVMMPESDGEELAAAFSLLGQDQHPVLVVTASSDTEKLNRLRAETSVVDILMKPVRREALLHAVNEALTG